MPLIQIPREKLWMMIGASYAAITALASSMIYSRHLEMLRDPGIASSGMYAAGDALTVIFFSILYLVPTAFVLRLLSENVRLYAVYSYVLLLLSITAPLAVFVLVLNSLIKGHMFESPALVRMVGSPMVVIVMSVSRWVTRSETAKRYIDHALLIECLSLLVVVALLLFA